MPSSLGAVNDQTIASWIWTSNVRPFCERARIYTGYKFDEDDWTAVSHGVRAGILFEYPFLADSDVTVQFHVEEDADEVTTLWLSIDRGSEDLVIRLETMMDIFATYEMPWEA